MSFSSEIKDEILYKIKDNDNFAEAFGETITEIHVKKDIDKEYNKYFEISFLTENDIKNIIKGTFLSNGYITDPNIDYHLEILFKNKSIAEYYYNLLSVLEMTPKLLRRKVSKNYIYVVYIKDSEQISYYLKLLEASKALFKYENIRIEKDINNNTNRINNCEVANENKILKTANIQIEAINKIKKANEYNNLNDKLKEVINVRINNKNSSMKELADILNISKSGLNNRMKKILEISKNIIDK